MSDPDSEDMTEATKREGASSKSVRKAKPAAPGPLTRGTLVGRYVLLDKIGEGGMGVVYGAFDPELDRKVAVKVLQGKDSAGSSGGDQAWLVREAQALARLSHPNVVAVHDVGSLAGDQVFVAMELVDGVTMRQWLRAQERTWREVVDVMRGAGAGLAAAHAAGLVHRDFKPENVIIGSDGRVRVMDFGLARFDTRGDDELDAGHVVGTPAYMAPEAHEDRAADARIDQFAFGVTLFEALYRARPFEKDELRPDRAAPAKPRIPSDVRVPARLQRIVLRAIAIDRDQRYASMDELLADLAIDPMVGRKRALLALGGVAAVGALVAGAFVARAPSRVCRGIDHRLAGVWDAAAKKTVHDAFVATKLPYAEQAYASLEHGMDAYTAAWLATATEACEATRVRRDQTEEVMGLREDCLDQRLFELSSFVRVLDAPSKALVEKGGKAVTELEPVARCSNVAALREPMKPRPEDKLKLDELVHKLADAKAQLIAGEYISAGARAAEVTRLATDINYMPAVSDAEFLRATTLMVSQSWDEAEKTYRIATWAGLQARRDDIVAHGALSIANIDVQGLDKPGEARVWLDLGKAAFKRLGTGDENLALRQLEIEGLVAATTGDFKAAVAAHRDALAGAERMFGRDNPLLFENEEIYAATLTKASEYAEAVPHYERALALRSRVVGDDHPDIALILSNIALCYSHLRDPKARPTFERAIALREKLFGKNSPILVPTLDNFGEFLHQEHDLPAAIAQLERAVRLAKVFPGTEHANYHQVATDYAATLADAGRGTEARALFDEVIALEDKTHSVTLPATLTARAELELAERGWSAAEADAQRAVDLYEAAGGKDNPALWRPLTALARARLELAQPAIAVKPLLDRALAIAATIHLDDRDLQVTRDTLARVESMLGK